MPTYEYICDACGHELEEFQPITAKPLKKCPACGKNKLSRQIGTGAGIIFKGSGFYETDYRSDSYKKAAKAESESSKPSNTTKSDSKSDSKPTSAPQKSGKSTQNNPATKSTSKKS